MAVPQNKAALTEEIINSYAKLAKELQSLSNALATIKELDGHAKNTKMSVNNLMAYLVGWGQLVLKWNYKKENGQKVDFPETGYKWNELGKLAQQFYKDFESDGFEDLLKKLAQTNSQILSLIASKTNEELYGVNWYEKWTLGRMIQFNTSSPYKNAHGRIRKWKKTKHLK